MFNSGSPEPSAEDVVNEGNQTAIRTEAIVHESNQTAIRPPVDNQEIEDVIEAILSLNESTTRGNLIIMSLEQLNNVLTDLANNPTEIVENEPPTPKQVELFKKLRPTGRVPATKRSASIVLESLLDAERTKRTKA